MSYREARWRQYCPNGGPLLCSGGGDTENCKKVNFLLLSLLLENFVKKNFTRIGPCERARTQLSEYVWHLGVLMIKAIVIAAQSRKRAAKVDSSRKIRNVTKKRHGLNFFFKTLFLLREVFKSNLETSLRRNKDLIKNCARVFFLWHLFSEFFFFWNLTQLWQPITLVQNLQISKTTTFSESSGRQLSHGPTLDGSYQFKILSNLRFSFPCFPRF